MARTKAEQEELVRKCRAMTVAVGAYAAQHPVFRVEELDAALRLTDAEARARRGRVINRLRQRGVLKRIARQTYGVVREQPDGRGRPDWRPSDAGEAYGAAGRVYGDGVIGFRSALEVYGAMPYRPGQDVVIVSQAGRRRSVRWGLSVRTVPSPKHIVLSGRCDLGVRSIRIGEVTVRVTGPERTFVDALHRPRLVGSWCEICEALARLMSRRTFDWRVLLLYVRRLQCPTTASRVGWFLERGQTWNRVPERVLQVLERLRSPGPVCWVWHDRWHCAKQGVRLATRWNIRVRRDVEERVRSINREMREGRAGGSVNRASA